MMGSISAKYAFRGLLRHARRTILSVVGVGVGCGIAIFATSWIRGGGEMQVRAASESGAGHLRVVPDGWVESHDNAPRLPGWRRTLAIAESLPGLVAAAPRARANGLLAFGNRTWGVEVVGVSPGAEMASNRIVRKSSIEGSYLKEGNSGGIVIGSVLARRLDVELDDDLLVTLSGRDEMQSAMFRIVGILETGSRELDGAFCHIMLDDLARTTGLAGAAEISILLDEHKMLEPTREALVGQVASGSTVISWKEVNPELAANVEGDTAFMGLLIAIIVVVVSLGIVGSQLTTVLERRHEFAILSALGMKDRQVVSLIMLEAVMIGLGGAVVALALGGTASYLIATKGVDIGSLMGGELSFGGVLMDPVIYGEFGPWIVWHGLVISVAATVVASVYPAWYAVRKNPASALRMV